MSHALQFAVHAPKLPVIEARLAWFSGWYACAPGAQLGFRVNGKPVGGIHYRPRPRAKADGRQVQGWGFWLETEAYLAGEQRDLTLEVLLDGAVAARSHFRYLPPRARAGPISFFVHVPKCAGTATRRALEHSRFRLLPIYDEYTGMPEADARAMRPETWLDVDIVFGHYTYGLHSVVQGRPYQYLTIVREPHALLLSLYFFAKYQQQRPAVQGMRTIFDYLSAGTYNNMLTRYLGGFPRIPKTPLTMADRELAIERLSQFSVIGLKEALPESYRRLSRHLGVELASQGDEVVNPSPVPAERRELDMQELRRAAQQHISHDLALYDTVVAKFWA
jgi:hypothetical protein